MRRLKKLSKDDMASYFDELGFSAMNMGGNCKAYMHFLSDGYMLITDNSGIDLPRNKDEEILVGYYDKNDEETASYTYLNFEKLKEDMPDIIKG